MAFQIEHLNTEMCELSFRKNQLVVTNCSTRKMRITTVAEDSLSIAEVGPGKTWPISLEMLATLTTLMAGRVKEGVPSHVQQVPDLVITVTE